MRTTSAGRRPRPAWSRRARRCSRHTGSSTRPACGPSTGSTWSPTTRPGGPSTPGPVRCSATSASRPPGCSGWTTCTSASCPARTTRALSACWSRRSRGVRGSGSTAPRSRGAACCSACSPRLLLYLSLTGIWLWFPRPSKWRSSMDVRWKRGRFARDTDLHKVAGMIAIPFLLMWAVTGASYEFGFVEKGWYAVTPGGHQEYPDPVSKKSKAADITPTEAVAAAQAKYPDRELLNFDMPAKDDPTAAYTTYFKDGFDPYGQSTYPGDLGVYVDRHTGVAKDFYGTPGESMAQSLYDGFNYPVHSGYVVNGWWRVIWLAFGLSPLLLAWTGAPPGWCAARRGRRARSRGNAATPRLRCRPAWPRSSRKTRRWPPTGPTRPGRIPQTPDRDARSRALYVRADSLGVRAPHRLGDPHVRQNHPGRTGRPAKAADAARTTVAAKHACTKKPNGTCIKRGQACAKAKKGRIGWDNRGRKNVCRGRARTRTGVLRRRRRRSSTRRRPLRPQRLGRLRSHRERRGLCWRQRERTQVRERTGLRGGVRHLRPRP